MAGQGPHEGALLALRAQRGVHLPEGRLPRGGRAHPGEAAREVGGDLEHGLLGDDRLAIGTDDRFGDVHDVDVGDVVELVPAGLAHAEHGEADELGPGHVGAGDRERPLERSAGQVREQLGHAGDPGERVRLGEVGGRDAKDLAPVGAAQRVGRTRVGGHRRRARRVGAHGVQQPGTQRGCRLEERLGTRGVGEDRELLGVTDERVAERRRAADDGEQPVAGGAAVPEHGHQPLSDVPGCVLVHPGQREQREVGVSRLPERGQQPLVVLRDDGLDPRFVEDRAGARQLVQPGPQQPGGG